jgi:hypothetical protein
MMAHDSGYSMIDYLYELTDRPEQWMIVDGRYDGV